MEKDINNINKDISRAHLWVDLLAVVGVFVAAQLVLGGAAQLLARFAEWDKGFCDFLGYTLSIGATCVFALWRLGGWRGLGIGFSTKATKSSTWALILWGFVTVMATSTVIEPLLALFPAEYMEFLYRAIGTGPWAVATTVVCAPILEEILFRGAIQGAITRRRGPVAGIVLSAAIFGLIHIIPQQAINAFFIGLILGYIYFRTGSLVGPIVIHALNNGLSALVMHLFPEQDPSTTLRQTIANDAAYWVVYGVCVLIFVIAAVNVWRQTKKTVSL